MTRHPGIVRMVNLYENTVEEVPVDEVPEEQQFVYLREKQEVEDPEQATEVIPVVEVRMKSLDDHGTLVPMERATKIVIDEFGPEGRPLRSTMMLRDE